MYVLRFYGNSHVIGPNVGEAPGWPELDVEFWGVNYPGFGGSTGPAHLSAMGPAALTAYDALRAEAGADRPILVFGTSFGTVVALCVAARHPEVAGVVLQNPPPLRQIILRAWGWWNLWLVRRAAALDRAQGFLRAVTSISIFIRGSARPADIIMAAGRNSPRYFRSVGQQSSKSAAFGTT